MTSSPDWGTSLRSACSPVLKRAGRMAGAALLMVLHCASVTAAPFIAGAWIRALPGDLPAAGYLVIQNDGDSALDLKRVSSPRFAEVMVHRSVNVHGQEGMMAVDTLTIPPHRNVLLAPGGLHLMLMDPTPPLQVGETVHLRFEFSSGAAVTAAFPVKPAGAIGP